MKFREKVISFLLVLTISLCHSAEHFQETLLGAVGGGNYSYCWLPQPGTVVLRLVSLEGDADLYVSSKNLKPTFDIENHEMQSTTCGVEHIKVPAGYDRPLSIAVYGHPSHEISLYELKIDVFDSTLDADIYPDTNSREVKKLNLANLLPHQICQEKMNQSMKRNQFFGRCFYMYCKCCLTC